MSLKQKVIRLFIVLLLATMSLLTGIYHFSWQDSTRAAAVVDLTAHSRLGAVFIDATLNQIRTTLIHAAGTFTAQQTILLDPAQTRRSLDALMHQYPLFDRGLAVFTPQGRAIAQTPATANSRAILPPGTGAPEPDARRGPSTVRFRLTPGTKDIAPVLTACIALKAAHGRPLGLLAGTLDPQAVFGPLATILNPDHTGHAVLRDTTGQTLIRFNFTPDTGADPHPAPRYRVTRPLTAAPWQLELTRSSAHAPAAANTARQHAGLLAVLITGIALVAALLLLRRIGAPLQKLMHATRLLEATDGDQIQLLTTKHQYWSTLKQISGPDEIGRLAQTYLTISKNLDGTMHSLRQIARDWGRTFNSISDAIVILDQNRRITRLNQAAATLFRQPPARLIGRPLRQVLSRAGQPLAGLLKETPGAEFPQPGRMYIWRHAGKVFETNAAWLRNEAGRRVGMVCVAKDVTELIRTGDALKASEARYQSILENIDEGVFETDLTGKMTFLNNAMCKMLGYTAEEIYRLDYRQYLLTRTLRQIAVTLRRVLQTGQPAGIKDYEFIRKNGQVRVFRLSAYLISASSGEAIGFRGVVRDVTGRLRIRNEKKALEAQLIQAQKMEAIGTLAGGIAHDFNNILTGMLGTISLMTMDLDITDPYYEKLAGLEQYIQSGARLTRQLLGFARGAQNEIRVTDLNRLLDKQIQLFGRTRKQICIQADLGPDLLPVAVDRGQIEQVLLNLCVNAADAMPNGGELFIETRTAVLDPGDPIIASHGVQPGRYIRLAVTDTGTGMDPATRRRIFEPFFTTKERGRGTGLGLASVYSIVKNHGGFIDVRSQKNQGATFSVFLPAANGNAGRRAKAQPQIVPGSETILLIDDETIIIDTAGSLLKKLGYQVLTAPDGDAALARYRAQRTTIDLVILDLIMPGMSGQQIFEAIRAIDPHQKILLASGYSRNQHAQALIDQGGNGFIQKPFSLNDLSAVVRRVLDDAPCPPPSQPDSRAVIKPLPF